MPFTTAWPPGPSMGMAENNNRNYKMERYSCVNHLTHGWNQRGQSGKLRILKSTCRFSVYISSFRHLICLWTKHHSAVAVIMQLAGDTAPGTLLCFAAHKRHLCLLHHLKVSGKSLEQQAINDEVNARFHDLCHRVYLAQYFLFVHSPIRLNHQANSGLLLNQKQNQYMLNIMAGKLDFQGQKQNLNHCINNMDCFSSVGVAVEFNPRSGCTLHRNLQSRNWARALQLPEISWNSAGKYQKGLMFRRVISSFIYLFIFICNHAR